MFLDFFKLLSHTGLALSIAVELPGISLGFRHLEEFDY